MGAVEKMKARGQSPRAVMYARFSSDNQREESIDAQLRAIRDYADKNGIMIVGEYIDKARSAMTDDRPQFLQMVEHSADKRFNIVLVHKLDRFARNRQDSIGYRMALKKNGVSLISVLEYLDEDSPESVILESVLEAMAEYYSKNLAREVRKGMKENALQCISTGGVPPFGYKLNPDTRKYEINEEEQDAVKLIFSGMCEGKGYEQIIKDLNAQGYKTRNGNHFGKNSIHEILRNEKYKGVYIFNRSAEKDYRGKRNNHQNKYEDEIIRIEGGMPAIVDTETFDMVSRIIASRKTLSPSNKAKETYLLSGKIVCGQCGNTYIGNRKFSGRNKLLHVTYRCNTRSRKTSDACDNKEIRREYIEDFVTKELARIIFNDDAIPSLVEKYREYNKGAVDKTHAKLETLKKQAREIEKQLVNITNAIAKSGSLTLISTLDKLEKEKSDLEEMIFLEQERLNVRDVTEEQVREAYKKARQLFLDGGLDEKRQLINLYLQKVIIHKEHVEVIINVLPAFSGLNSVPQPKSVAKIGGGDGEPSPVH